MEDDIARRLIAELEEFGANPWSYSGLFDRPFMFDRKGRPITVDEYAMLRCPDGRPDLEYIIIQQEYIGPVMVSTVWLGNDHRFLDGGPPIIFETMTFTDVYPEWNCEIISRYCTEGDALAGHLWACAMVRSYRILP